MTSTRPANRTQLRHLGTALFQLCFERFVAAPSVWHRPVQTVALRTTGAAPRRSSPSALFPACGSPRGIHWSEFSEAIAHALDHLVPAVLVTMPGHSRSVGWKYDGSIKRWHSSLWTATALRSW